MNNNLNAAFGIDFGTTKSATTFVLKDNEGFIHCGEVGGQPVTSAVTIDKNNGNVYVSEKAKEMRNKLGTDAFYCHSVKMEIDKDWEREIANKKWKPVDVAGEIFKELQKRVNNDYNIKIDKAVVAIPVGFSPEKREAIRMAAKKADIQISSFISEPTAAFFANYDELKGASNIAVFDWGGGTLDIAILKNENGKIQELSTKSIDIAGDVIDLKIAKMVHADVMPNKKFESVSEIDRNRLIERAELAKIKLSDSDRAYLRLPRYMDLEEPINEEIKYGHFKMTIESEVKVACNCLKQAIIEAGLNYVNIDRFLFVGGSCNLRPLQEVLVEEFGDGIVEKAYFPEEPEWNVAEGAAMLAENPGHYYTNQSIGLIMSDGSYFEILGKDQLVDNWNKEVHFGTIDQSTDARFIFSGSADIDMSNAKFRSFRVSKQGFLTEQIILRAQIDENLIFKVSAHSDYRPKDIDNKWWEYTTLKCYYKI